MLTQPTAAERACLDAIQPYVLLAVSTLITSSYKQSFTPLALLQRPFTYHGEASGGRVGFELPDWLPVEECLLSAPGGELHSFVKHLALNRRADAGAPGMQIHTFELPPGSNQDGNRYALTYFAWYRFAAPPYDFHAEGRVAHYVGAALRHACLSRGTEATLDLAEGLAILRLSDRLFIEVAGDDALSAISILLDDLETTLSFSRLHLTVCGSMFPDLHAAARGALAAGESFQGAVLRADGQQFQLHAATGGQHVQA